MYKKGVKKPYGMDANTYLVQKMTVTTMRKVKII